MHEHVDSALKVIRAIYYYYYYYYYMQRYNRFTSQRNNYYDQI